MLDDSLGDISLEDDPKEKWKKGVQKSNESRSEKVSKELEEAFNILAAGETSIDVGQVADYLDISKSALYKRIKKHEKFEVVDGIMTKKED